MQAIIKKGNKRSKGNRGRLTSTARGDVVKFAGSAYDTGAVALRLAQRLQRAINIETKTFGENSGTFTSDYNGAIFHCSDITVGTSGTTRVGLSVRSQRFSVRGVINRDSTATSTNTVVRVIFFTDLEGHGVLPTPTDVLTSVGTIPAMLSAPLHSSSSRYSIKYEEIFIVTASDPAQTFSFDLPLNHHIKWSGVAGTTAELREGHIYCLLISAESTKVPSLFFFSQLLYTDD